MIVILVKSNYTFSLLHCVKGGCVGPTRSEIGGFGISGTVCAVLVLCCLNLLFLYNWRLNSIYLQKAVHRVL